MNEKTLWFIAITSSLMTCGLLIPVWLFAIGVYFIIKAFTQSTQTTVTKTQPKVILPSNDFASDWEFIIRERVNEKES